jgi:hypothetical protein
MSRDDYPGESEENWKRLQDDRSDERARQFHEHLEKSQEKMQAKVRVDGADLADSLAADGVAGYLYPADKNLQYTVGTPDHQEVSVHAADATHGGDAFVGILVFADLMRQFKDAIDTADLANRLNEALDGRPLEELRTSISRELDKFSDTVEKAFANIQERITELVSPEKAQEVVQPDAPAQEPLAPEKAQDKAEPDARDPAEIALQEKQKTERSELDQKLATGRDRLEARIADKPEDVRKGLRDSFNGAAKDARDEQAAQHAEELRKLKEQQERDPRDHDR